MKNLTTNMIFRFTGFYPPKKYWAFATLCFFLLSPTLSLAEEVAPAELQNKITSSLPQVPEFAAIRAEAEKRGLRIWVLGGGASSIAEHAKQGILAKAPASRLTWSLDQMLFPEQDLDLVIGRRDGALETAEEVNSFLAWVRAKHEFTADGKSRWDAIGLKAPIAERRKMALDGNPDFLNQHNDSLSLGMIELTEPSPGESAVKNLGGKADFLADAAKDEFRFLFSPEHVNTSRFKEGTNPPILSAVRALEKSLRYQKSLDSDSLAQISTIIREWDPTTATPGSYVHNYLSGRAKRLITHAVNLEDAYALIESIGLKKKLLALPGNDPAAVESLAWWLNRSPLPKAATGGSATGKTAADLGIKEAYHWTSDSVHRLITWNYDGSLRAFQSREAVKGETAVLGNGFYTFANSPERLRQTLSADRHLRLSVDPAAREGIDFTYHAPTRTAVWKSSGSLKLIDEPTTYPKNMKCTQLYSSLAHAPVPPAFSFTGKQLLPSHSIPIKKQLYFIGGFLGTGYGIYYGIDEFIHEPARISQKKHQEMMAAAIARQNQAYLQNKKDVEAKAAGKEMDAAARDVAARKLAWEEGELKKMRDQLRAKLEEANSEEGRAYRCLKTMGGIPSLKAKENCADAPNSASKEAALVMEDLLVRQGTSPTPEIEVLLRQVQTGFVSKCLSDNWKTDGRPLPLLLRVCVRDQPKSNP